MNCNTFTSNATAGTCNTNGYCQVTACKTNYHTYNNACEADSTSHCGAHGKTCASNSVCEEGECVFAYNIGDIITFGHYEQDKNTSNGKEPIEWRVLDIDSDGHLLVISDKVLDVKPYNTKYRDVTWARCTIRSWLNGYSSSNNTLGINYTSDNFIDTAFIPEEKARIIASNVPAHPNPHYSSTPAGSPTTDKIFLLSVVEAESYFTTNEARKASVTLYARKEGTVYKWWLRSPGDALDGAAAVSLSDGSVGVDGVSFDSIGVRPALWLNL